MKIIFNETQTTMILADGRLHLHPKGAREQRDRRQVTEEIAAHSDVVRFASLGKILVLSVEEAAKREQSEKMVIAESKAAAAIGRAHV